ncbi:hypothetical protein D3C78_1999100 [compost metagenome]
MRDAVYRPEFMQLVTATSTTRSTSSLAPGTLSTSRTRWNEPTAFSAGSFQATSDTTRKIEAR